MAGTEYNLMAGDLMTIGPVTVAVDAPIEEAQRLIVECGVSGLPVVDGGGSLVGVISQTDFMRLDSSDIGHVIHHKPSGVRVGEVMTAPPVTVLLTAPLARAARTMLDRQVHRIVVVDDSYRAIGVLSAMDFVNLYADE